MRASRSRGRSPCSATPLIRFLFVGSTGSLPRFFQRFPRGRRLAARFSPYDQVPGGLSPPDHCSCWAHTTEAPRQRCRGASCSALDRIRTCGLRLRRATLYPAELRAQNFREANKPSSVPGEPGEDHFSGTDVAAGLVQPTRDCEEPESFAGRAAPRHCLALLRVGLAVPRLLPAARCALTAPFHPCLCSQKEPSAVCFLLRFPSPRNARTLSGTLPCGARTFLDANAAVLTRLPDPELSKMPRRGLEPPRRLRHQILSLACLPISAPGHRNSRYQASDSALERTRTSTGFHPLDPESSASTNSATRARMSVAGTDWPAAWCEPRRRKCARRDSNSRPSDP